MKKITILMLVMLMTVFALAGCGGSGEQSEQGQAGDALDVGSLKTMGDVIALEKEEVQTSVGNGKAVYAFKYGDKYYRVIADITEEVEKEYIDVDILEEGYEKKQEEILTPVEVTKVEDLSEQMPSEDELSALVGKTGQELVDEGWIYSGSYYLDEMQVFMDNGPFEYAVTFDGKIDEPNSDDFDIAEAVKDMKVKSVEFSSLGDASNVE